MFTHKSFFIIIKYINCTKNSVVYDVVFTDVITGEEYLVGYITSGVVESIKLEKGHWYTVKGKGILTISPVNVRIE